MMWWSWESGWFTMWLMMAFAFAGLSLLIVLAVRAEINPEVASRHQTDARQVLALRFARGEITAAEYLDRSDALSQVRDEQVIDRGPSALV
jgi:uncharacterized membrane protein